MPFAEAISYLFIPTLYTCNLNITLHFKCAAAETT